MANSFEEAAFIIRGLKERVERGKEERTQSGPVNVFRAATDKGLGSDTVTTTVDDAGSWTWDSSEWDHEEWSK